MVDDDGEQRIPLVAEEAFLTKEEVATDHVQVATHVEERQILIEETLVRGELSIKRVPVDREVATIPEPRQDRDTLVISIVEERLIVEKRLFVVEELHVTGAQTSERVSVPETLRTMRATVEHPQPEPTTARDSDD